jgi:membrane-bound lytic murein transglycosylase D
MILAGLLFAGSASAQEPAPPATPPAPESNDFATEGEESPELRALRMAELSMFGRDRPLVDATDGAWLRLGEPPAAFTSDAPGRPSEASARSDLAFLQGLSLPDIPVRWDEQVVRYLEFYRNDPRGRNIMGAWLARERVYGPMVRAKLREMGLPEDLSYVAMIESGFDPAARSHAAAVGMWQFVRATGEEYGLTFDHWVDDRRDPEKSTEAGARYLRDLYRRFGSWELAFAAYNMGYGALLRAIRKFNTNDYWVLSQLEAGLPFETTFYVAKIMACAVVGRNPERFGYTRLATEELRFVRVDVPGGTTLGQVARAAGVPPEEIATLNPALRRNRVPPSGTYSVRIPAAARERFATQWTRISPRHPAHRPYVLLFGETLADVARRFRTSEASLRSLNELDDQTIVGVGFELVVPAVLAHEPESAPEDRPVVAVPQDAPEPGKRRVFYRVTETDTAATIARFFRVSVDDLRRWNNVDPRSGLPRGLVLQLFVSPELDLSRALVLGEDDVRVLVVGTEEFYDYHEAQQGRVRFRYTVAPGDTLTSIAERFELSVGSLGRINRFARDTLLRAGQEIIIYAPRERVPREDRAAFDERVAEAAMRRGDEPPAPATPALEDDGDGTDAAGEHATAADAEPEAVAPRESPPSPGG